MSSKPRQPKEIPSEMNPSEKAGAPSSNQTDPAAQAPDPQREQERRGFAPLEEEQQRLSAKGGESAPPEQRDEDLYSEAHVKGGRIERDAEEE